MFDLLAADSKHNCPVSCYHPHNLMPNSPDEPQHPCRRCTAASNCCEVLKQSAARRPWQCIAPAASPPIHTLRVVACFALTARAGAILSCPVLPCRVVSCPFLSCPVLSCPALFCRALSFRVTSCPVLSCPVRSCPVLSPSPHEAVDPLVSSVLTHDAR